jgi:hypothetical protein
MRKEVLAWVGVIVIAIISALLIGADWKRVYGYIGGGVKFVEIETPIGPAYINVSHIICIRKTNALDRKGKTEISLIDGTEFYTDDEVEKVVENIIER